jgi:NAD(P)-dependent dehydrogenase (short-subunit alcohol dehydrogenase family)
MNRIALVTGAARGIGLGAAAALAEAGAAVTLVARRGDELEAVATAIRAAGRMAGAKALDITDLAATAAFVAEAGPFDVLVNSAGMARHAPALQTTPEDYDAAMNLNLRAAYFLAREVARGLIAAKKPGSLIQVSSQMGHVGGPDRAVYCANKHALEGMTKAMAMELAPRIRVNAVCPGPVDTPMMDAELEWFPDPVATRKGAIERVPMKRFATPEEIAETIVFVAVSMPFATGSTISVDGGTTAM